MWLPPSERRGEIQFHVAKSLPYRARLGTAFSLITIGVLVEIALLGSWMWRLGLILVVPGVLLLLVKGYENKAVGDRSGEWRPVTRKEVERIIEINKKQKTWDQSLIDITCGRGVFVFLLLVGAVGLVWMIALAVEPKLASFIVINAAALIAPFWVTGVRFILTNDRLIIKTRILLELEQWFDKSLKQEGEEFLFQLQTARTNKGEEIPVDVKALLSFRNGPGDFLGIQMQVSINDVQGTSYPYFYCVLVAKKEFGGLTLATAPSKGLIFEQKRERDVDIVVIRQKTTRTSGYHTKKKAINDTLWCALYNARAILQPES